MKSSSVMLKRPGLGQLGLTLVRDWSHQLMRVVAVTVHSTQLNHCSAFRHSIRQ